MTLNEESETFVIHIAILKVLLAKMLIYLLQKIQIIIL